MGHLGDSVAGWEWDSVLLLANPSDTSPLQSSLQAHSTLEQSANFALGQSWAGLESLQTNSSSPSDGKAAAGTQSSSSFEKTTTSEYELFRDPRLQCPNFLAGRVPCACTDNEDDDEGGSRSKRAKLSARCQVPACGADLAGLKGYHQRHRVCLQCANSTTVILRDTAHRYCQQCGKFHVLSDFDEGKRSCRYKLERHNNRRRRKVQESGEDASTPAGESDIVSLINGEARVNEDENSAVESNVQAEVEQSVVLQVSRKASSPVEQPDITDGTAQMLSTGVVDASESITDAAQEALSAPTDKHHGMPGLNVPVPAESAPLWNSTERPRGASNGHKSGVDEDSLLALLLEDSPNVNESLASHGVELASPISPRFSNKPSSYVSSHPTGRISFKLYDWNPGDFPRNLRQQILEWLSNMPVDLEGYIRSGCTILTLFISMPQFMWEELNADWDGAVARLVRSPQNKSGFWEKGYFKAKLGQQTVHFENGKLVNRSGGKDDCMPCMPVLQSVEPVCFRAGTGCMLSINGRNLLQANTKLLMSHGGKYIDAWVLKASSQSKQDTWQVVVPPLNKCQAGPVFIEVENEGRPSNTMVVLVGDAEFCNEVESLELYTSSCEAQDLLYDLGWMLKETTFDASVFVERLQSLLCYANAKGWERVAECILEAAERGGVLHKFVGAADIHSFDWRNIWAESTGQEHQVYKPLSFAIPELNRNQFIPSLAQSETDVDKHTHIIVCNSSSEDLTTTSLLPQLGLRGRRRSPWVGSTYRFVFAVASATMACAGLCVVLQHPEQVALLSTSLRRCLWSH